MNDEIKFSKEPNHDDVIWHFTNLKSYLSILTNETLCFTRPDKFDDPWEGVLPPEWVSFENDSVKDLAVKEKLLPLIRHRSVKLFAINCWHLNEYESAAMWSLYSHPEDGIAIQSTYGDLCDSLPSKSEFRISKGLVEYVDYSKTKLDINNIFDTFKYKRKSFEYEKEVRIIITKLPAHKKRNSVRNEEHFKRSELEDETFYFKVNLKKLVNKIYLSPKSDKKFKQLVKIDRTPFLVQL